MKNILTGALLLALVLSFWVQRAYRFPHTNLLPDATLVILAVLSLWLVLHGWLHRSEEVRSEDDEEGLTWAGLGRAVALLAAWVFTLPWLGFLVGSILWSAAISVSMRTDPLTIRRVGVDVLVNVGLVVLVYLAFTHVLYVRLPQLGGM